LPDSRPSVGRGLPPALVPPQRREVKPAGQTGVALRRGALCRVLLLYRQISAAGTCAQKGARSPPPQPPFSTRRTAWWLGGQHQDQARVRPALPGEVSRSRHPLSRRRRRRARTAGFHQPPSPQGEGSLRPSPRSTSTASFFVAPDQVRGSASGMTG